VARRPGGVLRNQRAPLDLNSDAAMRSREEYHTSMTNPAEILGLPKPAWAADEVGMLYDMAHRFMSEEHRAALRRVREERDGRCRASWLKAGRRRPAVPSMPEEYGGSAATFAHESAIIEAIGHVGVDGFGIGLHNAIVALHPGTTAPRSRRSAGCRSWLRRADRRHRHDRAGRRLRPAGRQDRAQKDGNHYKINGSKTFITNGQLAELHHRRRQDRSGRWAPRASR
jgi:acyl-CoA dehydrogenase